MSPVSRITGCAIPLGRANIDTDAIIGAAHLKTVSRIGLGRYAFQDMRAEPDNPLNDVRFVGAPILLVGDNFGCGSSREHAAWALADMGLRAIIAPSFSDIFAGNAFKNGIVAVELAQSAIDRLMQVARSHSLTVDLDTMTVTSPLQDRFVFVLQPFRRDCLMQGLDEIALTLENVSAIDAYEARTGT